MRRKVETCRLFVVCDIVVDSKRAVYLFLGDYAYELMRNRERKLETFYLVTSEYENRMSEESIAYRDELYAEMKSKLAELTQ